ncbi:MAG: copper resistance protein CopC/CopD [Sporichthyaceae bacterium]|nr:copper resistance protein CopC/CopD [Sporichthyaceae bacterium]
MRVRTLLAGATLGILLGVAAATPAAAHAVLIGSDPVAGQRLDAAPARVLLSFSEPVGSATVTVLGPDGAPVTAGEPSFVDPAHRQVATELRTGLPDGVYVVSWRVVSADSHPVRGGFSFGVGVDAPAGSEVSGSGAGRLVGVAHAAGRWAGYAGIALMLGGFAFLLLVWPEGRRLREPRRIVLAGAGLTTLATAAQLMVQAPYTDQGLIDTLRGDFGTVLLIRIVLLAVAVVLAELWFGWAPAPRQGGPDAARRATVATVATALAVAILATWPLAGHPRAADPIWLAVVVDAAHLGAVAIWLGGVAMLVAVVLRSRVSRVEAVPVVARFSPLALACVVVIAGTGSYQAWGEVGTPSALLATTYGQLVTAKIGLFAMIVSLGAVARLWIRGRVGPGPAGLRRSVGMEIAVAALILALASVLTATPPARTTYAAPLHTTVDAGRNRLEVSVEPARVGVNTVRVVVRAPDGSPVDVEEVRLQLRLADPQVGPLQLPVREVARGEFAAADATFPLPGRWQLAIAVRTGEFDQTNTAVDVTVR